jgi:hypothetical protein
MNYTVGDWTVESTMVDSISDPKTLQVDDLSWSSDYSASEKANETILINTTGSSIVAPEQIRIGRTRISDIYSNTDVPAPYRSPIKNGYRTVNEVTLFLTATNSVSGEELVIPVKAWLCMQVPVSQLITTDLLAFLRNRVLSATTKTGSVDGSLLLSEMRGDSNPRI